MTGKVENSRAAGPPLGAGKSRGAEKIGILASENAGKSAIPLVGNCLYLPRILDHEKSVRRLPSDRILKFLDGRFHWERMDQGVTRSTAGKHLKPMILGTGRLWNPEPRDLRTV